MRAILFEEPFYLAVFGGLALLTIIGVWLRHRGPRSSRAVVLAPLVLAGLFVVQAWVETPREQLAALTRRVAEWVESGDTDAVLAVCREGGFSALGGRDGLRGEMERLLRRYDISNARVRSVQATLDGDRAVLECATTCDVAASGFARPYVPSSWRLHFERADQRWWITDLVPLKIANQPYTSIREIP